MLIIPVNNSTRQPDNPAPESTRNSIDSRFGGTLRRAINGKTTHAVRRGDTLSEIVATALRAGGGAVSTQNIYEGVAQVAAANGITDANRIFVGQRIDLSALSAHQSARANPIPSMPSASIGRATTPGPRPAMPSEGVALATQPHSLERLVGGSSRVSSEFGVRSDPVTGHERHHHGVDLAARRGSPIFPLLPGEVVSSGWRSGYGNTVLIRHDNGLETLYAHNARNLVQAGDRVSHDTPLGLVGTTGRSTGNHLHFEVRRNGTRVDPALFLEGPRASTKNSGNELSLGENRF
jgi:murein DD-endopeptidase MepM/ murein hydrolase activator NlpD